MSSLLGATSVTSSGASLSGSVNPEGSSGYAFFRWGTTPTLSESSKTSYQSVAVNSSPQNFTATIGGLAAGTTYYYQMVFYDSSSGTAQYGTVFSLEVLEPVGVTRLPASITSSAATLNGTVNPEGSSGYAFFLWGTTPTLSQSTKTGYQAVVVDFTAQSFTATISSLTSGTTYYYQIVFYDPNNGGSQRGPILSFEALEPVSVTQPATSIASSAAILNGTVNPEGSSGYAFFLWGTTPTLSQGSKTGYQAVVVDFTEQSFTATIGNLTSGTTYYYRIVFYDPNNGDSQRGPILSFEALEPVSVTQPATSITSSAAILNGTVNPEGSSGYAFFLWGTTPTLSQGSKTGYQAVVVNFTAQSFAATIGSLTSGTTYYYQIVFYDPNNGDSQRGPILSFEALQ
jgi:hypothetical protein